eukprot:c22126_g1_i1 orf=142-1080(-)
MGLLFVFGDSYADTGNHNKNDPHLARPWRAPYGETWPGEPAGRFSDGSVLTDFIAQYLNISSPLPYSEWTGNLNVNFSGINFAFGGSGVFDTFGSEFPNITVQIDQLNKILTSNDTWWKGRLANSSVLFVCSGNDYIALLNKTGGDKKLPFFIPSVVNQIVTDLSRLYDIGMRRFLVATLEPAGCLPSLTRSSNFSRCNQTYNVWSSFHNRLLVSELKTLQNRAGSQVKILDQFNSFQTVLSTASKHGFSENPLQPCCLAKIGATCGDIDSAGKALYTVCSSPERAFFWDGAHPTLAGWSAVCEQYKQVIAT